MGIKRQKQAIIDCVMFNGEHELWDLHYNALKDHVSQFIVCEARTTFSGESKPLLFEVNKYPSVKYHVIDENWTEEEKMQAWASPQTNGPAHWTREFLQKESIKKALTHLHPTDIVFIGDVDEIWSPSALKHHILPLKLKLGVYTYYLNNRSTEEFWGTLMATYEQIEKSCLNHLRQKSPKTKHLNGWHFTSMAHQLHKKLTDSYTQESYATPEVLQNLAYNIEHNRDFLGRDFTYELNESGWPDFLKINRAKYQHLLKGESVSSAQFPLPDNMEAEYEESTATTALPIERLNG